jgi:uncharacterized membrane protein YdbT with pleckstrin-like domain
MADIDENLLAGEQVVYKTSIHKVVLLWPVLIFLIGCSAWSSSPDLGLYIILAAVACGFYAYLNYKACEYGVTNRRVLAKEGVLGRRSLEILLPKIEGIGVEQGMLGKKLGYGTVIVSGTGGTKELFKMITKPLDFRKQVQMQIALSQAAK